MLRSVIEASTNVDNGKSILVALGTQTLCSLPNETVSRDFIAFYQIADEKQLTLNENSCH